MNVFCSTFVFLYYIVSGWLADQRLGLTDGMSDRVRYCVYFYTTYHVMKSVKFGRYFSNQVAFER